jgi:hypothetical protein
MPPSSTSAILLLDVVEAIMGCRKYESEPIIRALLALGTVLLLPGKCGMEVKRVVKKKMLDRWWNRRWMDMVIWLRQLPVTF